MVGNDVKSLKQRRGEGGCATINLHFVDMVEKHVQHCFWGASNEYGKSGGLQLAQQYMEANLNFGNIRHGAQTSNSRGPSAMRVYVARERYRVNCDAAFYNDQYRGAVGCIVRDETGNFMGASFQSIPSVLQALVAEALAVREGLEFASRQGWQHIDIESDSQILIKAILGEFLVPLEINVVVEDIRAQGKLLDATFRYIRRSSNSVAHTITHWNCGSVNEATWIHSPPHWLLSTLLADCTS